MQKWNFLNPVVKFDIQHKLILDEGNYTNNQLKNRLRTVIRETGGGNLALFHSSSLPSTRPLNFSNISQGWSINNHTLYLSFFLQGQIFWRINANFSR